MVFGAFLNILKRFIKIRRRRLVKVGIKPRRKKSFKKQARRRSNKDKRKILKRLRPRKKIRKQKTILRKTKRIKIGRKKRIVKKIPKRRKKKHKKSLVLKKSTIKASVKKKDEALLLGEITHYFPKVRAAVVSCKKQISIGDAVRIKGSSTDFRQTVGSLQIDRSPIVSAKKGQEVGLEVLRDVKPGDKVYASI